MVGRSVGLIRLFIHDSGYISIHHSDLYIFALLLLSTSFFFLTTVSLLVVPFVQQQIQHHLSRLLLVDFVRTLTHRGGGVADLLWPSLATIDDDFQTFPFFLFFCCSLYVCCFVGIDQLSLKFVFLPPFACYSTAICDRENYRRADRKEQN